MTVINHLAGAPFHWLLAPYLKAFGMPIGIEFCGPDACGMHPERNETHSGDAMGVADFFYERMYIQAC
jgi:hypothetical protein